MSLKPKKRSAGQSALLVAAGMILAAPILVAPKCFDYDGPPPMVDSGMPDSGVVDAMPDGTTDAPVDTGPDFVPAIPCPEPNTAVFLVRNLEYQIVCGCAEAEGKHCTVPDGTTVIWNFADGVEHNVTSVEDSFERSSDRISGRYTHTFDAAGSYGYGCTLHPSVMSGYSLVVQ
jgi:hypothetical protein